MKINLLSIYLLLITQLCLAQKAVKTVFVGEGWANNSVNSVIFRKNSLVSFNGYQFVAYYNIDGFVVLGKRKIKDAKWQLQTTAFKGKVSDAHNCISIMVDGKGFLHLAWDHHNNALRYAKSTAPLSLQMSEKIAMLGKTEERVTYPEFYRLPKGDLLFFYRNGESGKGNLVMNRYSIATQQWTRIQENLVDGEGKRNAYWQACLDTKGTIHLSWVWRESPDVASNHDMAYAKSEDGGVTWKNSKGEKYTLPITENTAEYACQIPQKSELINQTSMVADTKGNPYIATYYKAQGDTIPQYHLIYRADNQWKELSLGFRKTSFSLSGVGTKRIPISRPQIVAWTTAKKELAALLIFRDEERGNKVSTAQCTNLAKNRWTLQDLTSTSVGSWEPTYDTELWKEQGHLHLFVERVEQVDGEGKATLPAQKIEVLEVK